MNSRFEQQQPLSNSGFVHSDALEQHVGKRVTGAPSRATPREGEQKKGLTRTAPPSSREP